MQKHYGLSDTCRRINGDGRGIVEEVGVDGEGKERRVASQWRNNFRDCLLPAAVPLPLFRIARLDYSQVYWDYHSIPE